MEQLELQEALQADDASDRFGRLSPVFRTFRWIQKYRAWALAIITLGILITALTCFVIFSVRHEDSPAPIPEEYFQKDCRVIQLRQGDLSYFNLRYKQYLYLLSRVTWFGSLMTMSHGSAESPIFMGFVMVLLHKKNTIEGLRKYLQEEMRFTPDETENLFIYLMHFLDAHGNYRSIKFIPKVPLKQMEQLVQAIITDERIRKVIVQSCLRRMYDASTHVRYNSLLPPLGVSPLYSTNIDENDIHLISDYLKYKKIEPWNQRVVKNSTTSVTRYELRVASANPNISTTDQIVYNKTEMYEESFYTFTPLDYSGYLARLVNLLHFASTKVRGDLREIIILQGHYLNSGSVTAHKSASSKWIKDSNVVEFYIGFLDTSRDPAGQRGLFQSITGVINRQRTATLDKFLLNINDTTRVLPWPTEFKVLQPVKSTMRAIDIVAMTPPVPTALKLPNYIDVRADYGIKNYAIMNVADMENACNNPPFLEAKDSEQVQRLHQEVTLVRTALHDFLSHSSIKYFVENPKGKFNFKTSTFNTITHKKVDKWYKPGETFKTVFGKLGKVIEEIRAEALYLFISHKKELMEAGFDFGTEWDTVSHSCWLSLITKTLQGFTSYTNEGWKDAQNQGRYVLLRYLMQKTPGLINITMSEDKGLTMTIVRDERENAMNVLNAFLQKVQIFIATADYSATRELVDTYSHVEKEPDGFFNKVLKQVIKVHSARCIAIQPNLVSKGNDFLFTNHTDTKEGFLESWKDRFTKEESIMLLEDAVNQKDKDFLK